MSQPLENEIVNESLSGPKVEIVYQRPKLFRRVMANALDVILLIFLGVASFLAFRAIVRSTEGYKAKEAELLSIRLESQMYTYDKNGVFRDVVTSINEDSANTPSSKPIIGTTAFRIPFLIRATPCSFFRAKKWWRIPLWWMALATSTISGTSITKRPMPLISMSICKDI